MEHKYHAVATVVALMAVLTLTYAAPTGSQPINCSDDHGYLRQANFVNVEALAVQLNLSNEQSAKIRDILNDATTPMVAMQEKMQSNREKLRLLHQVNPIDNAAVLSIGNKQAQLLADMLQLRNKTRAEINAVLTPEQLDQLQSTHHEVINQ